MKYRRKTIHRYLNDMHEKIDKLDELVLTMNQDIEWMKCIIKKLENRIWAILFLLISTLLSSILVFVFR